MSVIALLLVGSASLQLAAASVSPSALDSLASETAHRTARYADRRVAMGDGYRRIGTDFPGMGEHWLHSGALIAGRVDAARPTLLSYVTIASRPTLVGVGFVITTRGEVTTPNVPGWPEHWHEHSGLLTDESGAGASTPHVGDRDTAATRVWVLHVWTALDNPAGRYVSDNWALPFTRVGLAPPLTTDADVGRAFSLAVGGRRYLEAVLADAGLLHDGNRSHVHAALDSASSDAERISRSAQAAGGVALEDAHVLRAVWHTLGERLRALCGPAVDAIMAPKHGH